jgi:hypothetical protein
MSSDVFSKNLNWLIFLIFLILILNTVFLNLLIILSIIIKKKVHNYVNCLFVSSATADLLVGLINMPSVLLIYLYGKWPLGVESCILWCICDSFATNVSALNIVFISIHRLRCIISPSSVSNTQKIGNIHNFLCIFMLWFIPGVYWTVSIVSSMLKDEYIKTFNLSGECYLTLSFEFSLVSCILFDIIPTISILILQVWIYFALRHKSNKIAALEDKSHLTGTLTVNSTLTHKKDQKANRLLFVIASSSLSFWSVWIIIWLIQAKCDCVNKWIYDTAYLMVYLNSFVKPIQLITGQEMLKKNFLKLFNIKKI